MASIFYVWRPNKISGYHKCEWSGVPNDPPPYWHVAVCGSETLLSRCLAICLLKSRRTAREAYQERIQWVTQRCANSLWDSEEHSRGQDSSNAPVWRDTNSNTAEANLRQIQEHDNCHPSLPGFDNPVVQNSDTNQEAGQGATEVAHIPGALYQNIAMV